MYGTAVSRDLGGSCLEASKESGDVSAISQTFNNTFFSPVTVDVEPYITNDYWDMEKVELIKNIYNV